MLSIIDEMLIVLVWKLGRGGEEKNRGIGGGLLRINSQDKSHYSRRKGTQCSRQTLECVCVCVYGTSYI